MEGSLRATGSRLQVNAQLIDAETGAHVWADRFETDGNDLSAAEAEITGRLLWDLRLNLFAAASSRAEQDGRSDGNAKTIAMRGWSVFHRPDPRPTYKKLCNYGSVRWRLIRDR